MQLWESRQIPAIGLGREGKIKTSFFLRCVTHTAALMGAGGESVGGDGARCCGGGGPPHTLDASRMRESLSHSRTPFSHAISIIAHVEGFLVVREVSENER